MNPEFPTPREKLEARLTALLLGELPADEAFTLGRAIEQDAELGKLYVRLKDTVGFVRETLADPAEKSTAQPTSLKLSDQRREKLLAHVKTVRPRELAEPRRQRISWFVPLAAAAIVLLLGVITLPNFIKARSTAQSNAIVNNLRQLDGAKQQWAIENQKTENDLPTMKDLEPYLKGGLPSIAGEKYVAGKVGEPVAADLSAAPSSKSFGTWSLTSSTGFDNGRRIRLAEDGQLASAVKEVPARIVRGLPEARLEPAKRLITSLTSASTPDRQSGQSRQGGIVLPGAGNSYESQKTINATPAPPLESPSGRPIEFSTPLAGVRASGAQGGGGGGGGGGGAMGGGGGQGAVVNAPDASSAVPASAPSSQPAPVAAAPGQRAGAQDASAAFRRRYGLAPRAEKSESSAGNVELITSATAAPSLAQNGVGVGGGAGGGGGGGGGAVPNDEKRLPDAFGALTPPPALQTPLAQEIAPTAGLPIASVSVTKVDPRTGLPAIPEGASMGIDPRTGLPIAMPRDYRVDANAESHAVPNRLLRVPSQTTSNSPLGVELAAVPPKESAEFFQNGRSPVVEAKAEAAPILGDLPALGKATVSESGSVPSGGQGFSLLGPSAKPAFVAQGNLRGFYDDDRQITSGTNIPAESELTRKDVGGLAQLNYRAQEGKEGEWQGGSIGVFSLDSVGYINVPTATNGSAAIAGQSADRHTAPALTGITTTLANKKVLLNSQPSDKSKQSILLAEGQHEAGIEVLAIDDKAGRVTVKKADTAGATTEELVPAGTTNFPIIDTASAVKVYSELVGKKLLRPTPPTGHITFKPLKPLKKGEALQALEAALSINGISVIPVGENFIKAVPSAQANQAAIAPQAPAESDRATRVFQLQHVNPSELANVLTRLKKISNPTIAIDGPQILVLREDPKIMDQVSDLVSKIDRKMEKSKASLEAEISRTLSEPEAEPKDRPQMPAPEPQPEVQTGENTFSTFSLNVSDVSFKLAAASLEKGQMPELASIRSEEFINAFDYRDPEPAAGVPVAFAWERARYPFAHNRDLLRFSIKTAAAGRQAGRPLNIVLLLDNSGSMERADRVRIIHEALRVLASQLQPQDKLSVITFARTARLFVDGLAGDQAGRVAEEVGGLTPQGGTNLEEAMNLAYQTAARHYLPNGINRVVLLTDGAANLGDVTPESLKQKVETQRKQGIALDCFGIGWEGLNDDLLEILSRNGDGRYGFINTPEEAATEFAGQLAGALHVAASDVKVQIEFNPQRVTAYRQIGYAKHQLTKEQFRDNTVDAAEIGAAEAGNALYVIESNPAGQGPLAVVRVRFKVPGTSDYREHEWAVPYTGNAVALEQASPAMRLAATASAFSEWLVASPYAGEITPDRLLGLLSGVPEVYGADGRAKKLEWMVRQAKSLAGK